MVDSLQIKQSAIFNNKLSCLYPLRQQGSSVGCNVISEFLAQTYTYIPGKSSRWMTVKKWSFPRYTLEHYHTKSPEVHLQEKGEGGREGGEKEMGEGREKEKRGRGEGDGRREREGEERGDGGELFWLAGYLHVYICMCMYSSTCYTS